jgi:hypothetical protein
MPVWQRCMGCSEEVTFSRESECSYCGDWLTEHTRGGSASNYQWRETEQQKRERVREWLRVVHEANRRPTLDANEQAAVYYGVMARRK